MFDVIGDLHGNASKLLALLKKMGYSQRKGYFCHPEKKIIFTGDFIDRGVEIAETLYIVRNMVENNAAIAVMGNHEYNALCFHYTDKNRLPFRAHNKKNIEQHKNTLHTFANKQSEWKSYLEWFWQLPLFYEDEFLRVVHACWDSELMKYVADKLPGQKLTYSFFEKSAIYGTKEFKVVDTILKGKEISLPDEMYFYDKDNIPRNEIRYKWWEKTNDATYNSLSVIPRQNIPDIPVDSNLIDVRPYGRYEKPVFFGHYWLVGTPQTFTHNVCCVDYSVAKGGKLVAYRFKGEKELNSNNFVAV